MVVTDNWDGQLDTLIDMEEQVHLAEQLVTRVRTNRLNGAMSENDATNALANIGIVPERAAQYIQSWNQGHSVYHRQLTANQILFAGYLGQIDARERLINLGFSPDDADLMIQNFKPPKSVGSPLGRARQRQLLQGGLLPGVIPPAPGIQATYIEPFGEIG